LINFVEIDKKQIETIKLQLATLNNELHQLNEKRRARKRKRVNSGTNGFKEDGNKSKKRSGSSKDKKKRIKRSFEDEKEPDEISYEQKRELSDNINILAPEKMQEVLDIIKENTNLPVLVT
jgi:hypothetical protein